MARPRGAREVIAYDISNYSVLTPEAAEAWAASGIQRVIVGIPHMPGFAEKVAMLRAAGIEVEAYQFANYPLEISLLQNLEIRRVWVDVEDEPFDTMTEKDVLDAILSYENAGFAVGVYTNAHAWRDIAENIYAEDLPLWWANPDGDPFIPFGGWVQPTMVQVEWNFNEGGVNVDVNTYQEEDMVMEERHDPQLRDHLAVIDGLVDVGLGIAQVLHLLHHDIEAANLTDVLEDIRERVIAIDDAYELNP